MAGPYHADIGEAQMYPQVDIGEAQMQHYSPQIGEAQFTDGDRDVIHEFLMQLLAGEDGGAQGSNLDYLFNQEGQSQDSRPFTDVQLRK